MSTITTVGSINADLYVRLTALPQSGQTIPGRDAAVRPGGKGANQAAAVARLGVSSQMVGQVGNDTYAPLLSAALHQAGVYTSLVSVCPGPSGQAMILLQDNGDNAIVLIGGANQNWTGLLATAVDVIAHSSVILLQREIPEAINIAAATIAREHGIPVILDAGGSDTPIAKELLGLITVLSPNESELAQLTGMPTHSDADIEVAARSVMVRGVNQVLVKLGSRGSVLFQDDQAPIRQGVFAVDVVDTTGAGDCFTAAYAVALLEGKSPADRLAFAAAAAALCVTKIGAMPSLPDRAAVEALLGYDKGATYSRTGERSSFA